MCCCWCCSASLSVGCWSCSLCCSSSATAAARADAATPGASTHTHTLCCLSLSDAARVCFQTLTVETCFRSGPATILRRQTPPTPKTPSPLKVGAGSTFTQKVSSWRASPFSLSQKSPSTWTNRTPSPPPAVRMGSRGASSPPPTPAAESPSMNLHFTRRRRRLKVTKCAGSVPWRGRSGADGFDRRSPAPPTQSCVRFSGTR